MPSSPRYPSVLSDFLSTHREGDVLEIPSELPSNRPRLASLGPRITHKRHREDKNTSRGLARHSDYLSHRARPSEAPSEKSDTGAAATIGIEPSQNATLNSTSQLLHLNLTPHIEHLIPLPTARSVSPNSEETSTSLVDVNPLAQLALKNQTEEEEEEAPAEVQQPESCIQGVAEEPCPLMDVRRRCGTAGPIGIDRALNYTFLQARFTLVGSNFALKMGLQDKTGKPVPVNGTDVTTFSNILVRHGCKRQWGGWLKWAGEMAGAALFAYVVTKVMDYRFRVFYYGTSTSDSQSVSSKK